MADHPFRIESFPAYDRHGPALRLEIYDHILYFSEAEAEAFIDRLNAAVVRLRELNQAGPEEAARWLDGDEPAGDEKLFQRISIARRRGFWRGFREGYLLANSILLPPFLLYVIGHYRGWWR